MEGQLKEMVEQRQLDLLDEDRKLVFQGMSDENPGMLRESSPDSGILEQEQVNIRLDSPDAHRLAKSQLAGEGQAIQNLESEVIKFVKQNSIVDGAKHL